ncbi:MAG: FtsX-like permease family protein [Nitrospirae bacterium]|nr:FtsX-like permease family protein [Nitrospirota bacterium]
MTLFRLALRNLWRQRFRTVAITLATALAAGFIFSASTIIESVESTLQNGMAKLGADIMVVPDGYESKGRKVLLSGEPTAFYMDGSVLPGVTAIKGIEKVSPQLFMVSAVLQCCSMPTVLLVAYDTATDFTITPWVSHINKLPPEATLDPVTIGAETLYASEGPYMTFFGKKFRVGSSMNPTGMRYLDYSIFMTMQAARDMIEKSARDSLKPLTVRPDQISSIMVKVSRDSDIKAVAGEIEASFKGIKALLTNDMISSVKREIEASLWSVIAAGLACWAMTIMLIGLVFAMSVNERQRELGLIRAMGATRFHTLRLIVTEASIICGIGGFAGVSVGLAIIVTFKRLITHSLGNITFLWPSPVIISSIGVACIVIMTLSGALAALVPALKSCRKEPYDAIRQGSNGQ